MSKSENEIKAEVMLEASKLGWTLFRNNVGVAVRQDGTPVRYGLANISQKMNQAVKSSDLIGIRPVLITPEMVGHTLGQFVAIEVKKEDWKFSGKGREAAQLKFIDIINGLGGYACFVNGKLFMSV